MGIKHIIHTKRGLKANLLPPGFIGLLLGYLLMAICLMATAPSWGQVYNQGAHPDNFISVHLEQGKVYFGFQKELFRKPVLMTKNGSNFTQVVWVGYDNVLYLESHPIVSLSGTIIPLDNDTKRDKEVLGIFPMMPVATDNLIFAEVTSLFSSNANTHIESRYFKNETLLSFQNGSIQDYYSFYLLPEPMSPRRFDYRMGFFMEDHYSALNHFPKNEKGNIQRWRMARGRADDGKSYPKEPLVFILHSDIPKKYRPYVKAGILEWLPAFKAAGFADALVVKDPPTEDEIWKEQSISSSFVVWKNENTIRGDVLQPGSNARNVLDFRSGEILKTTIKIGAAYDHWATDYLIRCGPLDQRALQKSMPEKLTGAIVQALVAHEAGHAFGLKDGNYGEYAYPLDSIRSVSWLKRMGHTPSVMNYARAHHVAQPEDSIPSSLLIQKVGPTDIYSIEWGYREFGSRQSEEDFLNSMISRQDSIPWYIFITGDFERKGPQFGNEVADNDSPVESARLGTDNLKRVIQLLPKVTKTETDNGRLERLYVKSLELWRDQMLHVASLVGGYVVQHQAPSQSGPVYRPIPKEKQSEALDYLVLNVFDRPEWLASPDFTSQFEYSVASDKMLLHQLTIMKELIGALKLKRMEKMEVLTGNDGLLVKMISNLQDGLWKELNNKNITIDPYRQELQMAYITFLRDAILKNKNYGTMLPADKYFEYTDYSKSIFMSQLFRLRLTIGRSIRSAKGTAEYGHLALCKRLIDSLNFDGK